MMCYLRKLSLIEMRFWCISTSRENWSVCKNNLTWGMDSRYYVTLEKYLKSGDKAVVYTTGGYFVATVQFEGDNYYDTSDIGWKKNKAKFIFPYRIKFKILETSDHPPKISFSTDEDGLKAKWSKPNLIYEITFIADKGRTWNQYVQVSIIRITEEDYLTVKKAITESSR